MSQPQPYSGAKGGVKTGQGALIGGIVVWILGFIPDQYDQFAFVALTGLVTGLFNYLKVVVLPKLAGQ